MPFANSAQTHANARHTFRRPAALIFIFAIFALLTTAFLAFPRQKPCNPACVVLIGDSITPRWQSLAPAKQLSGLQIVNRGIPSDSTSHMLSRFNHDVVRLHPRVVVILGGINDIERNPRPQIEQNLACMAEPRNNMEYMLCSPLYSPQASRILINYPRRTLLVRTIASLATTESCSATTKSKH